MWGGVLMDGAAEGEPPLIAPTEGLAKAAQQCFALPVERFYGRDYAETERKITAKAARLDERLEVAQRSAELLRCRFLHLRSAAQKR